MRRVARLPEPAPYTLAAFLEAWNAACVQAWDEDDTTPSVTLPEGVLPELASVLSPVTAEMVEVQRVPVFTWERREPEGAPCRKWEVA
jgi:hypothetical protein